MVYAGIVEKSPNATGFGFISNDEVKQKYGGVKDVFLHLSKCPWVKEMDLQEGEPVLFNLAAEPKDEPQVKRIVRPP
jgi:cold shock CspA family protein